MVADARSNVVVALEATVHRVLERLAADLGDLGLTHGEINALAQLQPGPPRTVAELQAATGQRASTLTGVLDRLERRGLVERRPNPVDRRSYALTLTDRGAEAASRVASTLRTFHRRLLRAASPASVDAFFEVLAALDEISARD